MGEEKAGLGVDPLLLLDVLTLFSDLVLEVVPFIIRSDRCEVRVRVVGESVDHWRRELGLDSRRRHDDPVYDLRFRGDSKRRARTFRGKSVVIDFPGGSRRGGTRLWDRNGFLKDGGCRRPSAGYREVLDERDVDRYRREFDLRHMSRCERFC